MRYILRHPINSRGSSIVETLALGLVFITLFLGLSQFLRTHHHENPEVLAQRQCNQQMSNVTSLFSGLFEKQTDLTDSTQRVEELSYLNDVIYSHSNTAARNFTRMWFTAPVITHDSPIVINTAQFRLDSTNLAQALYNGDRRYCTEQYGLNTLNGKSIREWIGETASSEADEIFLKIEPIDRAQHTKLANCQHPIWTAPQGRKSFHDVEEDGFKFDGNSNLGFQLTWTAMKRTHGNELQPQCQLAENIEHQPDVDPPASPVLMSLTNGNGANLMDPSRSRTTCDSEEGKFDEVRMNWEFDRKVKPGVLFLCRTWTVYGEAKPDLESLSANAAVPRLPETRDSNVVNSDLQMKTSAHPWNSCFASTFEVGTNIVPLQMTIQSNLTSTSARIKVERLPKVDAEYFVEMKLVDQTGSTSPSPAIAEFIMDMNRPDVLKIQDGNKTDAMAEVILGGTNPSNFKDCEIVSSDIPDIKSCYDGEKCLIQAPHVTAGDHSIEVRGRDVCGKLSSTAKYEFKQEQERSFASVDPKTQSEGLPVGSASAVNQCVRPAIRNLGIRCQTAGVWGAWSNEKFRTPASLQETSNCEFRYDVIGASTVEHRGVFDHWTHKDARFTPAHSDTWSTITESFPIAYINPKSFFRTEYPLVLYPMGDCFNGQPFTYEMVTSCQQGECQLKPSLNNSTCLSNSSPTH